MDLINLSPKSLTNRCGTTLCVTATGKDNVTFVIVFGWRLNAKTNNLSVLEPRIPVVASGKYAENLGRRKDPVWMRLEHATHSDDDDDT